MLKFDWNILWTIINLIFFFVLMKLVLFKPIKKVLDKRQEIIDEQFKSAEEASNLADSKLADYEGKIANVDAEAEQIIAQAKDDAKAEYNKIIDRAENDAQRIKDDAKKQMQADAENARRAAKEELASLAIEAAEKVVGKTVDDKTNSDLFDEFLNESSVD